MNKKITRVNLPNAVGAGYGKFWRFKGRYRVVKGSRASKKSKTTALWYIVNLMKYPQANLLVVRKTYRSLKDSCYTELKWAVDRLKVSANWDFTLAPLEATYRPTGQKIYFRGLDDPLKIASITVQHGTLCWLWIEEAYEIMNEAHFDQLDESIRGEAPGDLFKQITLTFNPWNDRHWLKRRFFDNPSDDTLALTTNYLCNEFLDEADIKLFEHMKHRNPRRYQVAGLGNWGVAEGLIYENWKEQRFTLADLPRDSIEAAGLDYGYTNDPTAYVLAYYSDAEQTIFIYDEFYKKGLSNKRIAEEIAALGYQRKPITADSSEPKSTDELRSYGLMIKGAIKGPDSVLYGIQWIQDKRIIIHPRCVNFITEISNYAWEKDKFGRRLNKPIDEFDHLQDALRYALEDQIRKPAPYDAEAQIKALKSLGL